MQPEPEHFGKYPKILRTALVIVQSKYSGSIYKIEPAFRPLVGDNQPERQAIDIYDSQGNVKEHVIIKDDYITIYDKDWKTKGYGKAQQ